VSPPINRERDKKTLLIIISMTAVLAQTPAAPAKGTTPAVQGSTQPAPAQSVQTPEASDALLTQVMLDRAGFSPGLIDGQMGANTRKALELFTASGMQPAASVPPVTSYRITPQDAGGPFISQLSDDMMENAKLESLGYTSLVEALAERFHTAPAFLKKLNPDANFAADQEIRVPNVEPMILPVESTSILPPRPAEQRAASSKPPQPTGTSGSQPDATDQGDVTVTVAKSTSALTVSDSTGRVLFYAPVTTGSAHDPLPIGEWKVRGIWFNPKFHYNPELFWDAEPSHTKATIQPGPNNPVGVVWIDLSKDHYGLHGTPEPASVGRTQSHGCVRLTNWDALRVAALIKPGTPVIFKD
jgi:lipoprotein-anchoring transpeptidase ErfK/SrfK